MKPYIKALLAIHDLSATQLVELEEKLGLILKIKEKDLLKTGHDLKQCPIALIFSISLTLDEALNALKYCKYHFGAERLGMEKYMSCGCSCSCNNCICTHEEEYFVQKSLQFIEEKKLSEEQINLLMNALENNG